MTSLPTVSSGGMLSGSAVIPPGPLARMVTRPLNPTSGCSSIVAAVDPPRGTATMKLVTRNWNPGDVDERSSEPHARRAHHTMTHARSRMRRGDANPTPSGNRLVSRRGWPGCARAALAVTLAAAARRGPLPSPSHPIRNRRRSRGVSRAADRDRPRAPSLAHAARDRIADTEPRHDSAGDRCLAGRGRAVTRSASSVGAIGSRRPVDVDRRRDRHSGQRDAPARGRRGSGAAAVAAAVAAS